MEAERPAGEEGEVKPLQRAQQEVCGQLHFNCRKSLRGREQKLMRFWYFISSGTLFLLVLYFFWFFISSGSSSVLVLVMPAAVEVWGDAGARGRQAGEAESTLLRWFIVTWSSVTQRLIWKFTDNLLCKVTKYIYSSSEHNRKPFSSASGFLHIYTLFYLCVCFFCHVSDLFSFLKCSWIFGPC